MSSTLNRLIPVILWNNFYDWPTKSGLRRLIFNEDTNGFTEYGVIIRPLGKGHKKPVLIDEQAFFEWAKRNTQNSIVKNKKSSILM